MIKTKENQIEEFRQNVLPKYLQIVKQMENNKKSKVEYISQ